MWLVKVMKFWEFGEWCLIQGRDSLWNCDIGEGMSLGWEKMSFSEACFDDSETEGDEREWDKDE